MASVIRIQPKLNEGLAMPRSFDNYDVATDESVLPSGVALI